VSSQRRDRRDDGWTREESRFIDGMLDAESARRLEAELERHPERRARVDAWRDAMDLWRDDVTRESAGLDPDRLKDAVLSGAARRREEAELRSTRAARRYAAAAILLIGLGLAGATAVGPQRVRRTEPDAATALLFIEHERLELQKERELAAFPLVPGPGSVKER